MARKYAFLTFAPGIDWKDVNATLLSAVNRLGMKLGKQITITSGYRSYAEQERLYARYVASGFNIRYIAAKPGRSFHEQGLAVDAYLDGKPITTALGRGYAKTLAAVGLSAPVKGDLEHLQLLSGGKPTAGSAGTPSGGQATPDSGVQPQTQLGSPAQPDVTIPAYQPPGGPPSPFDTVAQPEAPGTGGAGINPEPDPAQAWQEIAAQPVADPTTAAFAQQVAVALGR